MPQVAIDGIGSFEVPAHKRLVNALIDECGQDQLHACGGLAKCTTCKVEFLKGEPATTTEAENNVLIAKGLVEQPGLRLSCQMTVEADMAVKVISRFAGSGRKDSGKRPAEVIEPPPVFIQRN